MRRFKDHAAALTELLARYGLALERVPGNLPVPGSYWGAPEAGLVGRTVHAREDTPVHSVLHEMCHVVCMPPERRVALHTDAGGTHLEECAVCYLQVVLATVLYDGDTESVFRDMDAWGYTFRLGSARAWFSGDANDARDWLIDNGLLDARGEAQFVLRGAA